MQTMTLLIDRGIMPILTARIGERAAHHLIEDLANPRRWDEDVHLRLATVLGSPSVPSSHEINLWTSRLHYNAMIAPGAHWNGNRLTIDRPLPDTMMLALIGMPLSAAVDHPLLPTGRIITAVENDTGRTVIMVEEDEVTARSLCREGSVLTRSARHWRQIERTARHAMHRGGRLPALIALVTVTFLTSVFVSLAITAGDADGKAAGVIIGMGAMVAAAGWIATKVIGRLMREGSEISVLQTYHAVRTCMTREAIEQDMKVDPRTYAIL